MIWELSTSFLSYFNLIVIGYYLFWNLFYTALLAVLASKGFKYPLPGRNSMHPLEFPGHTAPPISTIRVTFNEQDTIVESVKSLLDLEYPDHEISVINDGSVDHTLKNLITAFNLKPVDRIYRRDLTTTGSILGFYASDRLPRLTVVDKKHSGHADSLNVGINMTTSPFFCVAQADVILQQDALLHLARPIWGDSAQVIASTSSLRIANGCTISDGQIVRMDFPTDAWSMLQILDQLKDTLLAGWGRSRLFGLGRGLRGFTIYQKKTAIKIQGFDPDAPDVERDLLTRLYGMTFERERYCQVATIQNQVAWVRLPRSFKGLASQHRVRELGSLVSLASQVRRAAGPPNGSRQLSFLLLNALLFTLRPIVEIGGYAAIGAAWTLGILSPQLLVLFLFLAIFYGVFISVCTVLMKETVFRWYTGPSRLSRFLFYAVLENFGYRQLTSWWRLQAIVQFLMGWRQQLPHVLMERHAQGVKALHSPLIWASGMFLIVTLYVGYKIGHGIYYGLENEIIRSSVLAPFRLLIESLYSLLAFLKALHQKVTQGFLPQIDPKLKIFLLLSFLILADGVKVVIEILHRARPRSFASNPNEVTALVPCHNSAGVIRNTLANLQKTFTNDRIIVIDDASTDNTKEIAENMGVRVYRLARNKGKVAAIHFGVYRIKTRYTLLLDDDTRIGYAAMPTSLLEEGYTAVAFNLLPSRRSREIIDGKNLLSCLQRYEYGKSMEIGKRFEDVTLSVSCISGAAGLFLTQILLKHHHEHSNVFAGEDLERTLKILMRGGKIAFASESVWTLAPDGFYEFTRQRLLNWGPGFYRNLPNFVRILFSKNQAVRLRFEMLYNFYVILSDPIKVFSLAALIMFHQWQYLFLVYLTYLGIEIYPFIVVEKKLPAMRYYFPGFLLYPVYGFYNTLLRFLSFFVWIWERFISKRMKPRGKPEDRIE